jgi:choline dehydrogenase-like flavoprotein
MITQHRETERGNVLARAYDYVIVGGGSAGCVVASRLTDGTDASVLLMEAGGSGDGRPSLWSPPHWVENIGSTYDWTYRYEPSPYSFKELICSPLRKEDETQLTNYRGDVAHGRLHLEIGRSR